MFAGSAPSLVVPRDVGAIGTVGRASELTHDKRDC